MPRNQNRRSRQPAVQAETATKTPDMSEKEYCALVVGLKDRIFTEELDKHFATQPWSDGIDAVMAFETLTEPTYLETREPDIPVKFIVDADGMSTQDPEYEVKLMHHKMQISKYGYELDKWSKNVKNWKNNCSCMFAIVPQHCPADL
eukprot:6148171-Ditylum_brightwellii.AAC.1